MKWVKVWWLEMFNRDRSPRRIGGGPIRSTFLKDRPRSGGPYRWTAESNRNGDVSRSNGDIGRSNGDISSRTSREVKWNWACEWELDGKQERWEEKAIGGLWGGFCSELKLCLLNISILSSWWHCASVYEHHVSSRDEVIYWMCNGGRLEIWMWFQSGY